MKKEKVDLCYKSSTGQVAVARNPCQGDDVKLLCICQVGALRSPTAARVLQDLYGFNTRACGLDKDALVPLSETLLIWADRILCFSHVHAGVVEQMIKFSEHIEDWQVPEIEVISISDDYDYMETELVEMITYGFKV